VQMRLSRHNTLSRRKGARQERGLHMRKHVLKLAGAAAIVATVLAVGVGPALAKMTCTVTNGGTALPATQKGSATFNDTVTQQTVNCSGGTESVTAINGSGQSISNIAQISNTRLTSCTGPFGSAEVTQVGTASVNLVSFNSSTHTASGTVTNLDLKINGSLCGAELVGTVNFSYRNSTGTFTLSPDGNLLTAKSASCSRLLFPGDVVDYKTVFVMDNTPFLQLTSP
jgi:hypothetical protein